MSGLYSMLMGRNPFAPYLLASLGITMETQEKYPLGRIRDVYTNDAADRIFILTRNYGEEWEWVDEALAKHPTYIGKTLCSDSTYSVYEFGVPQDIPGGPETVKEIAAQSDNTPAFDRYTQAIRDMQADKDNAQTRHMKEVGKKIFGPLIEQMQKGGEHHETISTEFGSVEIHSFGGEKDG